MGSEDVLLTLNTDLLDDDFCGLSLEPLSAFCESIESSDIETFLQEFEDSEKCLDSDTGYSLFDDINPLIESELSEMNGKRYPSGSNENLVKAGETRIGSWSKLVKSESKILRSRNDFIKKKNKKKVKGVSLLAKPPKSKKIVNSSKKSSNGVWICPIRFAAYFYQHHNYCSNPYLAKQDNYQSSTSLLEKSNRNEKAENTNSIKNLEVSRSDCKEVDHHSDNIINLDKFDYNEIDINCNLYVVESESINSFDILSNVKHSSNVIKSNFV